MFAKILCSAALSACLALPVMAQSTTRPVIFAAGATGTAVTGQVTGRETADFTLIAEAGQRMTVRMNADNASAYFNIYAPGDVPGESQALFIGSTSGATADLTLPASGTYLIRTYLMANAGREDERAQFSLTFDVAGRKAQSGDVANALNSEPDFWKVTGITGTLNIRAEASTTAAVAGTVPNDTALRSLGCQAVDGRNWCKVETVSGTPVTGWAASDFLAEGTAPDGASATPAPAAAAVTPTATPAPVAPVQTPTPSTDAAQQSAINAAVTIAAGASPAPAAPATTTTAAPAPAPAAPAGTVAPTDKPVVVATRPPVAPPTKIPLGGVARQPVPAPVQTSVSSAKPAPKPAQPAAAAAANTTASGTLPCSTALGMPTRDCAFTVTRSGKGNATVKVSWPDGGFREIQFENGTPRPISRQTTERRGGLTVINIENERYEITDAIVNGG